MAEVWIHHATGVWYVTRDGIELIDRAEEIAMQHVQFVIDPVGIERARTRGKKSTCAWAVGQRIDPRMFDDGRIGWERLHFRPAVDDHFHVNGGRISGCGYLYVALGLEGEPHATIMLPEYGDTERRQVQQYGKIR